VEQEQKPREQSFIRALLPDRLPTTAEVVWSIRITVVVIVVLLLLSFTSWLLSIEFMNLLKVLAVPITVGAAVPFLNWLQKKRELEVGQLQKKHELEIENQRAQDEALQAYLDQIGQLLLDKERPLRKSQKGDEERTLARARTKEVLWKLSPHRKRNVLQFLYEACLIKRDNKIIHLSGADLRNAYLWKLDLRNADLRGADIKGADLSEADLSGADLRGSMLGEANLRGAYLIGADLDNAKEWTEDQLIAAHLEGATMPNGQKYEDWLKDREGEENSGPS
jgi:hypothetical protein